MGEVAEKLAELTVSGTSPDGQISARIRAGELVEVGFRAGAYQRYAEPELAHQLARTATLLYVGHERGVQQVMEDAGVHRATDPAQARDETHRQFLEAIRSAPATGSSPDELVRFEIAGMAHWQCRIADGTLGRLSEAEFIAEVSAAAADLLRQSRWEKALLKNEFFGTRHAPPVQERIRQRARQHH